MVYDTITRDYVPRFGMGSVKKVEEKFNWLMEDKEKYGGKNPFTYLKEEKKLQREK
jgi:hypothetical protein